jgi:NifB/MoaA-like Fe-S oxidoreductase
MPMCLEQGKAPADLKPKTSLTSIAAAALAAAKAATSVKAAQQHGMVAVVETRKFAGKDIQV